MAQGAVITQVRPLVWVSLEMKCAVSLDKATIMSLFLKNTQINEFWKRTALTTKVKADTLVRFA